MTTHDTRTPPPAGGPRPVPARPCHVTSGSYAPPAPERELTVTSADGTELHVETHGPRQASDTVPTVVLAHGWTCSTAFWAAQLRNLAADHHVIAYDQRGHGRSEAPAGPEGYGPAKLADDLEAVLRATLAPGCRVLLAGHSMGGMTIMAAARRPAVREHAAAALLIDTGMSDLLAATTVVPLRAGRLRTWLTSRLLGSPAPVGRETALSRRILKYVALGRGASPEMVRACAAMYHGTRRMPRHRTAAFVLAVLDVEEEVRHLDVPTAVLVGSADRLTPVPQARAIHAVLPQSLGVTELPGLGHNTPVEAPDEITARIRALTAAYVPGVQDPAPVSTSAGSGTPGSTSAASGPSGSASAAAGTAPDPASGAVSAPPGTASGTSGSTDPTEEAASA